MFTKPPNRGLLISYALLSCLDLILTRCLLTHNGGVIYESNPIARVWLHLYGWAGLAVFKILTVELVAIVSIVLSLSRPHLGERILTFACLVLVAVNGYSASLLERQASDHQALDVQTPHSLANLYVCPECHAYIGVPDAQRGQIINCPGCHTHFPAVAANQLHGYSGPAPYILERPFHESSRTLYQILVAAAIAATCTVTALLLQPACLPRG